jgi:DNA adenine methylase
MQLEAEPIEHLRKPFLKWAGSKTRLVKALRPLLPLDKKRYVEPFVGAGALFLNTKYPKSLLSDTNLDLIQLYTILKGEKEKFIKTCRKLFMKENNRSEAFYEFRKEFNKAKDPERRAALFVYLNRHGYNGLCRYNQSGEFNVPFGTYNKIYFPEAEMLGFAERLQTAELKHQDFRKTFGTITKDDAVYCDPPYVPLSKTSNFTSYAAGGFSATDQRELAELCYQSSQHGAVVIISNHDTPGARKLYQEAESLRFESVSRTISCNGENRKQAKELIAVFQKHVPI